MFVNKADAADKEMLELVRYSMPYKQLTPTVFFNGNPTLERQAILQGHLVEFLFSFSFNDVFLKILASVIG